MPLEVTFKINMGRGLLLLTVFRMFQFVLHVCDDNTCICRNICTWFKQISNHRITNPSRNHSGTVFRPSSMANTRGELRGVSWRNTSVPIRPFRMFWQNEYARGPFIGGPQNIYLSIVVRFNQQKKRSHNLMLLYHGIHCVQQSNSSDTTHINLFN